MDKLEKHTLPQRFETVGEDTKVRVPELARSFYKQTKYGAKMKDQEAGYAWLQDNGGQDLIKETVNAGSLSAFLREKLKEEGIEPDPDVIEMTSYATIGSSKYNPK